ILEGSESLNELSEVEKKFMALNRLKANERLACQAKPKNLQSETKIIIQVPKIYQLPHILYND
ncbi:MAG: ferredoxin, partial [Raineya sp.]|nr:ferredoxin [Raineya sp.]